MANKGIQFEAYLDDKDDPTLRLYEPYTMTISEFKKTGTKHIGDAKLPIDKFESAWASDAINIGFANDNYYYLASRKCTNCKTP